MIDIQAMLTQSMNMTTNAISTSSSNSKNDKSEFLSTINKIAEKIDNSKKQSDDGNVDVKDVVEDILATKSPESDLLQTLFGNDAEEIDIDSLMQLFAGIQNQTINLMDFANIINENGFEISNIDNNLQLLNQDAEQGIDVSMLEIADETEIFKFNLGEESLIGTKFTKLNDNIETKDQLNFNFTKGEKTDNIKSDFELFNSYTNKNFNFRDITDEGDAENELLNIAMVTSQNEMSGAELIKESGIPTTPQNPQIFEQVKTGIIENAQTLEIDGEDFVMTLNPASLGEITIKLINDGGKATLSIVAANQTAMKLINDDLGALRDTFKPLQIQVRDAEIAVVETQEAQMQQFDMNNQNFEQNKQNFNEKGPANYGNNNSEEQETEEEIITLAEDPNNLSIYI